MNELVPPFAVFIAIIVGVIVVLGVFSDHLHNVESNIHVERFDLMLVSEAKDARIVICDFLFLIDKEVPVTVGGDMVNALIPIEAFFSAGDVEVVKGSRIFVLKEPAAPGDEVEILIRHGANETAVTATVKG